MREAPEPFISVDDADPCKEQSKTEFFERTLDTIGISAEERRVFCEIKTYDLYPHGADRTVESDDRLTVLIVRDRVAASVLERRDDLNFTEVLSAVYTAPL